MDFNKRLERAIDYIEANISREIDFEYAARLACSNRNELSNMFFAVTGIPLSEYVRRRRLSLAALEIENGDERIIDVAMKYGYASPTAFSRAFQNQHKASPQYVRSRKIPLVTYPRISLQIILKGDIEMKVRIESKPAFTVVGIKRTFRNDAENLLPQFWGATPKETYDRLRALSDSEPKWFVGVCADFDGGHEFDYYIAVASTQAAPEGFCKYGVPAATWAILEKDGALGGLAARFWREWLPSSGYRRADETVPDVEVYPDADMPKENYNYELWYPVVKE